MRRWLPWILKGGLSLGLIWLVLSNIDVEGAMVRARNVEIPWVFLALLLIAIQVLMGAYRWQSVLQGLSARLPMLQTMRLYFIGIFFNICLPGAVGGDAIRMWQARRQGLPLETAVNSVLIERVVTVFALLLLVTMLEPLMFQRMGNDHILFIFPLLTLLGALGIVFLTLLDRLPKSWTRWRIVRGLGHVAKDSRAVFLRFSVHFKVLGVALLGHATMSIAVWSIAQGLALPLSVIDALVLVPPVMLAMTLPISIAGWGVREGAMVAALAYVGIPADAAVALSVLWGLAMTFVSLPGGIVFLMSRDRQMPPEDLSEKVALAEGGRDA